MTGNLRWQRVTNGIAVSKLPGRRTFHVVRDDAGWFTITYEAPGTSFQIIGRAPSLAGGKRQAARYESSLRADARNNQQQDNEERNVTA